MMLAQACLRGTIIIAIAALITLALGRRSAAMRHHIWASALIIQLALLAFIPILPSIPLPIAPRITAFTAEDPAPAPNAAPARNSPPAEGADQARSASTTAPTSATRAGRIDWKSILFYTWAAGASLIFLRYVIGTLLMARLARKGRRVDEGEWLTLAQRIAKELGITRPVTLLWGDELAVPITWGILYPMILLPESARAWTPERRRFVLVHELAHVRRFDALTQLVAQVTLATFWFSPFVWLSEWRLRVEREHACDDVVLRHGTEPTLYADELLQMVRALVSRRAARPAFAALAMARKSEFEGRMLAILDPTRRRSVAGLGSTLLFTIVSLLIAAPVAALDPFAADVVMVQTAAAPAQQGRADAVGSTATCDFKTTSTSLHADVPDEDESNARFEVQLARPDRCLTGDIAGRFVLTDDETTVRELGANAHVHLREVTPRLDYAARIEATPTGALTTSFWVNGKATADNGAGQRWIASILPIIMREASLKSPQRIDRLLNAHGLMGTLETIARIQSPAARTSHYLALIEARSWDENEIGRIRRAATATLEGTPTDLTRVLRALPQNRDDQARNSARQPEWLERALLSMTSDTELRSALTARLPNADKDMLLMLARVSLKLQSGYEKSGFLVQATSFMLTKRDRDLETAWFKSANTLASSTEHAAALTAAIAFANGNARLRDLIAESASGLASDSDKLTVLRALAAVQ